MFTKVSLKICVCLSLLLLFPSPLFARGGAEEPSLKSQAKETSAEPRYGGSLRVATTSSPRTLDPIESALATREIGIHIFETLVAFNAKFEVVPELAESWEVKDNDLTYTFKLRRGVTFHNGKEMTAADVKASIKRFKEIGTMAKRLEAVETVDIDDDYTITLRLKKKDGILLAALASPLGRIAIMPKEVVENVPRDKVEIIGTGPYRLVEWIPDRHTIIRKYEKYKPIDLPYSGFSGRKQAYLDEIIFVPVPDANSRAVGLEVGDYDFADFIPASRVEPLKSLPGITVTQIGPFAIFVVWINHASPRIGNDLKLRQAIQAGLDMEELKLAASDGVGELNPGIHFKNQRWHCDSGKELYNQANLKRAKELLSESNYRGEILVILASTDYDYMYKGALNMADQLDRMGIKSKIKSMDFGSQFNFTMENPTDWDLYPISHSTRFDPSDNVDPYFDASRHVGRYDPSQEVKEWITKARQQTNMEDRIPFYCKIQQRMYDEVLLWYKLYDLYTFQAYNKEKVRGYFPWVMIHFFNTWIAN